MLVGLLEVKRVSMIHERYTDGIRFVKTFVTGVVRFLGGDE